MLNTNRVCYLERPLSISFQCFRHYIAKTRNYINANINVEHGWALAEAQYYSFCSITNGDEGRESTFLVTLAR